MTASRIFLMTKGEVIPAEKAGKLKTAFQVAAISIILVYRVLALWPVSAVWTREHASLWAGVMNGAMALAVTLTVWSGLLYFRNLEQGREK